MKLNSCWILFVSLSLSHSRSLFFSRKLSHEKYRPSAHMKNLQFRHIFTHTRIHKRKYIYMFINSIICLFCRNGKENSQNIRIDVNFPRSCSIDFDTYSMNFHKCLWQIWKKTSLNLYAYRSFVRCSHSESEMRNGNGLAIKA